MPWGPPGPVLPLPGSAIRCAGSAPTSWTDSGRARKSSSGSSRPRPGSARSSTRSPAANATRIRSPAARGTRSRPTPRSCAPMGSAISSRLAAGRCSSCTSRPRSRRPSASTTSPCRPRRPVPRAPRPICSAWGCSMRCPIVRSSRGPTPTIVTTTACRGVPTTSWTGGWDASGARRSCPRSPSSITVRSRPRWASRAPPSRARNRSAASPCPLASIPSPSPS